MSAKSDGNQCHGITRSGDRCSRTTYDGKFCRLHPTSGGLVTKTGFAELQGVGISTVSRWLSQKYISETDCGRIDWEAARLRLEQFSDPAGGGKRRQGEQSEEVRQLLGDADDGEGAGDSDDDETDLAFSERYERAKALEKEEKARKAKLERIATEDWIADQFEQMAHDVWAEARSKLMTLPSRITGELMAAESAREMQDILEDEIRNCLTEIFADAPETGGGDECRSDRGKAGGRRSR